MIAENFVENSKVCALSMQRLSDLGLDFGVSLVISHGLGAHLGSHQS